MDDCVYMDYSIKDTCCWEPQGNGHYLTRCGKLHFDRRFSPTIDKTCRICGRPFDDATYINAHEPAPAHIDEDEKDKMIEAAIAGKEVE